MTHKNLIKLFTFLVALFAIGSFLYYHGFQCSHDFRSFQFLTVRVSFAIFLISYLIECSSSPCPKQFVQQSLFESALLLLVTLEVFLTYLSPYSLSGPIIDLLDPIARKHALILLYQSILVFLAFIELGKRWLDVNDTVPFTLSPAWLFVLSYVLLIVGGSCLLKMPEMTASGESMELVDALFTSISANCVTGLIVVDTATFFSPKGHALLILLIQLGGLNIISFAIYFAFFFQSDSPTSHKNLTENFLHLKAGPNLRSLLAKVLTITLIAETLGAMLLYVQWQDAHPALTRGDRIFFSLFHSISAFNNAGFTLFTGNLTNPLISTNYASHTTIAALIILGGIGFPVVINLAARIFRKERISLGTKIALTSSVVLIFIGTIFIAICEDLNLLQTSDFSFAFFQSVTSRTAGFNTIPLTSLSLPTIVLIIVLMFIGTSSASTGGGIKTSTLSVALKGLLSKLRRQPDTTLYGENIPSNIIKKSFAIISAALVTVLTGALLLVLLEPSLPPVALVFEAFSAFGTVGLSLGITENLSDIAKVLVMVLIFTGRVGPMTLMAIMLRQKQRQSEIGPIMIG